MPRRKRETGVLDELHADYFARVNTRVTRVFKKRLQLACTIRERETARVVPEGEILSELGMQYLPPHPDELAHNGTAAEDRKERKRRDLTPEARRAIADAQRKRWAKARAAKG